MRLARTPLPTFLLVLVFNGGNDVEHAFLIHVGEEHIRATLKRLRELSQEQEHPKLHKYTRDFTWSDADRLPTRSGMGLETAVKNKIAMRLEEYAEWKLGLIKTAGYEAQSGEIKIRFRPPSDWSGDPQDLLVDFALGLIPYLELESGELIDVRFGIPDPEPKRTFPAGTQIQIVNRSSVGKGEVRFRVPGLHQEVRIVADTFVPHGVTGVVDENRLRTRFSAPFVDLVFDLHGNHTVNFNLHLPDPEEEHPLTNLHPSASFIMLMNAAHTASERLRVEMFFEGERLGRGELTRGGVPAQPLVQWATLIEHAWVVARSFEIEQDTSVRVTDLARFRDQLLLLHAIFRPDPAHFQLTFWLDTKPVNPDQVWCYPLAVQIILGQYTIQVAAAAVGSARPTGEIDGNHHEYVLETTDVRRHHQRLYTSTDQGLPSWEELIRSLVEQYEPTMNVLSPRD